MTWQRIDENTYVDDTLVTCAEYQLFIDNMREHGKYYQPDHWITYQFPQGQAWEPILGVSSSDARDFCAWLTRREVGEWIYRVPVFTEAYYHPLIFSTNLPIRYWVIKKDGEFGLIWLDPSQEPEFYFIDKRLRARDMDLDIGKFRGRVIDSARKLDENLARDLELALDRARTSIRTSVIDYMHDYAVARIDEYDKAREIDPKILDFDLNYFYYREQSLVQDYVANTKIKLGVNEEPMLGNVILTYPDLGLLISELIDWLILRESVAARIDFKSIRLVRERLK